MFDVRHSGGNDTKVFRAGLVVLMLCLTLGLANADDDFEGAPEPKPTNAVEAGGETFTAVGTAPLDQGAEAARFAALLDAYRRLTIDGLRRGDLAGGWGEMENAYRFFGIDADHPNSATVAWLTRAKVTGEKAVGSDYQVTIESPAASDLASLSPPMRAMISKDVDGDGVSDVASIGFDGAIYVTPGGKARPEQGRVKSPSYAVFEVVSGPGFERVRASIPTALASIEPAGEGYARAVLGVDSHEVVNGRLLGHSSEQREVLVSLTDTAQEISFTLDDPPDFTRLFEGQVELRGKALASQSLASLEIRHNGELAWESPEGINLSALKFDLARPLNGGWNLFRLTARDQQGALSRRDLWLHGPPSKGAIGFGRKRAVVCTLDDDLREKKLQGSLSKGGFLPESLTLLESGETTPQTLLESIRDSRGADELLLYLEATSLPGQLVDGKVLKLGGAELSSSDLAQAIDAAGYQKALILVYTELDSSVAKRPTDNALWQDTDRFLSRLGDGGRLVIANLELDKDSARGRRNRSRDRLLKSLDAVNGGDLVRLVDSEAPSNTLFRGWMYGLPVLSATATET